MKKHLVLIDGYGFVFRAFHSLPPLTRSDGTPVGAVYGFTSMLLKVISDFDYSHIAVVFDSGGKSFRHEIFADYKANRPSAPDDLIPQFPLVRESAAALALPSVEMNGMEADDLIATYSAQAKTQGFGVTIISSDKDLMQLVDDQVKMYDPMKMRLIDRQQVFEKFGVFPERVRDALALIGDSSDNVKGVPGIGPKTAAELLTQYGSLEGIYENLDQIKQPKRRESLTSSKDVAFLAKRLITLESHIEVPASIESFARKSVELPQFTEFCSKNGFNSLMSRAAVLKQYKNEANLTIKEGDGVELEKFISEAKSHNFIAVRVRDNNLDLAFRPGELLRVSQIFLQQAIDLISKSGLLLIGFDIKSWMHRLNVVPEFCFDDLQLMSYSIENGLADHVLERMIQTKLNISDFEDDEIVTYQLELYHLYRKQLVELKLTGFYEVIERKMPLVFFHIEQAGVKINFEKLRALSQKFSQHIAELETNIYQQAGSEFNIGSPQQLAEILFDRLNLPVGGKTSKTKSRSTNADILQELANKGYVIAENLLKWRHYSKLKNTYTDNLIQLADQNTCRIHCEYNIALTSTGRVSSSKPNLQNIPIKSEDGAEIRRAFIADVGRKLISADYSQIELRILAHIADVKLLKQAFIDGIDIHKATASEIFGVKLDVVTADMRRHAKGINFGIAYGISAFGLADNLGISTQDAKNYINRYFEKYPEIKAYMEQTKEFAKKNLYAETIFKRRCYLPNINSSNYMLRSLAERAAINAPIQGSQADIIKKAMIKLDEILKTQYVHSRMILQIHDELLIESPVQHAEEVANVVKSIMEEAVKMSVAIPVSIDIADHWE